MAPTQKDEPLPPPPPVMVRVDPFVATQVDPDHLVLHRDVHVGDERYVQGLVVVLPALVGWLHEQVVEETGLGETLRIAWPELSLTTGPDVGDTPYRFDHRFEDPFASLTATASLSPLPGEGKDPRSWVVLLASLLTLFGILGFIALYRMVAVVVHFAERRNNFVASVSHELKTPLTSIRMYGEILRDGMVTDEDRKQLYYETITGESERLSRLIQNVLELSRLEKGTRNVALQAGQVGDVVDEVVRLLAPHARERGFDLITEIGDDLPPVKFDRDALLQVLINLVDNALKFAGDADAKEVVVKATRRADGVALTVLDYGPGVPQAQLRRVFQPFFRGERELTRNTKGTGIGLALVRGLVERMEGSVSARNLPAGGFEVTVALS